MEYKLQASGFKTLKGVEAFYCNFANRSGWALIFLHERTGAVTIQSDYGDWSYIWPPYARSETLKEFICTATERGSTDYLACKFMGSKKKREEFSAEKTREAMKRRVFEHRREKRLDKDKARSLFDEIDRHDEDNYLLFMERLGPEVHSFFNGEPWEYAEKVPTHEYLWLTKGILPALVAEIRKTIKTKNKEVAA